MHTRKKVVNLIILIYLLLILEGAIRKWVLPQFEEIIFFIRIPVTLWLYFFVFKHGIWPRPHKLYMYGMMLAVIGFFLIPIQLVLGGYELRYCLLAGYGWVNYFFYIPLAFIIAEQLRAPDFYRILKITLILAIIAAPLSVLQLFSPMSSPLVQGFGTGMHEFQAVGIGPGFNRPMGFFSSSVGQQLFAASAVAFVLALWIIPSIRKQASSLLRVIATLAVLVLIGTSMQRSTLIQSGIVFLFAIMGGMITRRKQVTFRSIFYPVVFVVLGVTVIMVFMPDVFDVFSGRWLGSFHEGSSEYEIYGSAGFFGRIYHEMTKFLSMLQYPPLTGWLIGIAGNAATQLSWVELPDIFTSWVGAEGFAEDGLSRNIVELGPVFGLLFIAYRFLLFFWFLKQAVFVALKMKDPLPMVLLGFITPVLLSLQMTGHGSIVGYAWIFIGFTLAAIRISRERVGGIPIVRPI